MEISTDEQLLYLSNVEMDNYLKFMMLSQLNGDDMPRDANLFSGLPEVLKHIQRMEEDRKKEILADEPKSKWKKLRDVVITSDEKFSPLHFAAMEGRESMAQSLLESNANVNLPTAVQGLTPLHLSSQGGHLSVTQLLLEYNANVSAEDKTGMTPLHDAADIGHFQIVELLINAGAPVNAEENDKFTPLHLATKSGHTAVMELLIKNGAKVDATCSEGTTPLFGAAVFGHLEAAACLIRKKCNVDVENEDGETPLHNAIYFGHAAVVSLLIKHGAKINGAMFEQAVKSGSKQIVEILIDGGTKVRSVRCPSGPPLITAVVYRQKDLIEVLIRNGANGNYKQGYPLTGAVSFGFPEIVEELLLNGTPIKINTLAENCTALHFAAQLGHLEVAKILLKYGADVHAQTTARLTPLFYAAAAGHKEVVELFLTQGAKVNVNTDDGTALHGAATFGYHEIVQCLLLKGANIMAVDLEKKTPLEHAVNRGHLEVVKTLLSHDKKALNAKTSDNVTFLHIATRLAEKHGNIEMVKLLVASGANVKAIADEKKPIHVAARYGSLELFKFFLSKGEKIEERTPDGRTPLHYACIEPNMDVVKYLVEHGANIDAQDQHSMRPIVVAAHQGHNELLDILLRRGAKQHIGEFTLMSGALTQYKDTYDMLLGTSTLPRYIKENSIPDVLNAIEMGANLNARYPEAGGKTAVCISTCLHLARVTELLLKNGADPNIADFKQMTPLHYAVEGSDIEVIFTLLAHGAFFDQKVAGKTPMQRAKDGSIMKFFKIIEVAFNWVAENCQCPECPTGLQELAPHQAAAQAVMGARNHLNQTLLALAVDTNFSQIDDLKAVVRDVTVEGVLKKAAHLVLQKNFDSALVILTGALRANNVDVSLYGPFDVRRLAIEWEIARVMYQKGEYYKVCGALHELYKKQIEVYGTASKESVRTKALTAKVSLFLGKFKEASEMFQDVFNMQKKLLGVLHEDTMRTQFHMAMAMHRLLQHDEALQLMESAYLKLIKEEDSAPDAAKIRAKNNYAIALQHAGKLLDACIIFNEVLAVKKQIFGVNHKETCRTLVSLAEILLTQKKSQAAVDAFVEVVAIQKKVLPTHHPEGLITLWKLARAHFANDEGGKCYDILFKIFDKLKAAFGPKHESVVSSSILMLKVDPSAGRKKGLNIISAAKQGDLERVICLARVGFANDEDSDGNTALHFAAKGGHVQMVEELLKNDAEVTKACKKGLTPLHMACLNPNPQIVEILLNHMSRREVADFVDASTSSCGSTALHFAARQGSLPTVKSLLKQGATFSLRDNQGKRPSDLAMDAKVRKFFRNLEQVFDDIHSGMARSLLQIARNGSDDVQVMSKARDENGLVLFQIAGLNIGLGSADGQAVWEILDPSESETTPQTVAPIQFDVLLNHINNSTASDLENFLKNNPQAVKIKDAEERTGLHHAVFAGNLNIVKALFKCGACIHDVTNKGNTPLHLAVLNGNKEIAKLLLRGLDDEELSGFVNVKTKSGGSTALHVAVKLGRLDMVKLLLQHEAMYNVCNNEKKTPVQLSSDKRIINFFKLVENLFQCAESGDYQETVKKLHVLSVEDRTAVGGARDVRKGR